MILVTPRLRWLILLVPSGSSNCCCCCQVESFLVLLGSCGDVLDLERLRLSRECYVLNLTKKLSLICPFSLYDLQLSQTGQCFRVILALCNGEWAAGRDRTKPAEGNNVIKDFDLFSKEKSHVGG